ncbi:MAG: DUF4254 domain-containing protein [Verrucomicrobia bacterium]|nr:DUF4254 domain-containing protein [Verrucomicrobiota bacterium]
MIVWPNHCETITALHDAHTEAWHGHRASVSMTDSFSMIVIENHRRNFDLWHVEDEARREDLGIDHVYHAKRKIDRLNAERNDLVERIDQALIEMVPVAINAPLNSETPGQIIDRLSILSLKIFHMAIESMRADAEPSHRENSGHRLEVLFRQRSDLSRCLGELMTEVSQGRRGYRIYFQFKMYNDPAFNPSLYGQRTKQT